MLFATVFIVIFVVVANGVFLGFFGIAICCCLLFFLHLKMIRISVSFFLFLLFFNEETLPLWLLLVLTPLYYFSCCGCRYKYFWYWCSSTPVVFTTCITVVFCVVSVVRAIYVTWCNFAMRERFMRTHFSPSIRSLRPPCLTWIIRV